MFSPAYGVAEDAATGSAAGPLLIHLIRHQLAQFGQEIRIEQGIEMGRRSEMRAIAESINGRVSRVEVSGAGVITAEGMIIRWR
jgi:trans-2,3-dihydro-3-hydroxyanthranilate isomerase